MDLAATRQTLQRLVTEADAVSPSITHFGTDHHYGRVTDESMDGARCLAFEVEAGAVLASLSRGGDSRFVALHQRYLEQLQERTHSRSIQVHKTQIVLRAAVQLLDTEASSPPRDPQDRAMRLLEAIRSSTELSREPVFATDLAAECSLSSAEAQAAWRYLRDQHLIDTFRIDYTARINAQGLDRLMRQRSAAPAPRETWLAEPTEASERRDLPAQPEELLEVLRDLWTDSVASGTRVDAPVYREKHRISVPALTELERRRCIARDGDHYRLTPLGVLSLSDTRAWDTVCLGEQVRAILQQRFRNTATRTQPYSIDELARELNLPREHVHFALFHLTDAVGRWCIQYTPDFAAPDAILIPAGRVLEGYSVGDIARELASWAATTQAEEVAVRDAAREVPSVPTAAIQLDALPERWIKRLKNNWFVALIVVAALIVVSAGNVVDNGQKIWRLIQPHPPSAALTIDEELARDMAIQIDLCKYERGSSPVIECVAHGACRGTGAEGIGFAIDKSSKESAVYSCKQSCRNEASRLHAQCATPPPF